MLSPLIESKCMWLLFFAYSLEEISLQTQTQKIVLYEWTFITQHALQPAHWIQHLINAFLFSVYV